MSRFIAGLACAALVIFACLTEGAHRAHAAEPQHAVLVTGASTGIGRKIAERLAADGHFVFAGARKPDDIAALLSLIHISEPTRPPLLSRMPSSA